MDSTVNSTSALSMVLFGQFTLSDLALQKSDESMFAFAARAEHENDIAEGVHWVAVDGKLTEILHSFARVVEKFREGKKERKS